MALVVVERALDGARDFGELQAKEDAVKWCLDAHRVRALRSLFALDRARMVCLYEAPDAESVREVQRAANLPVEHLWSATPVVDQELLRPNGYTLAVVQRAVPEGVTLEQVRHMASDPLGCGKRMRLHHISSFLALDCRRMCCAYYAPDLESVRVANREMGAPVERVWAGELISAHG